MSHFAAFLTLGLAFNLVLFACAVIVLRNAPRWSVVLFWGALLLGFVAQVAGGYPSLI